jgi:UDP-glucose 4-epimerase
MDPEIVHPCQSRLAGERVVITGASGFLGSHLCRRLIQCGATIDAISRSPRNSNSDSLRWWRGDVADGTTALNLLRQLKPDVIFHLSGLAKATPERELVLPTMHTLLVSSVNMLMAAAEIGCRRIFFAASLTEPISGSEITPGSPYAAAKWASGAYARMFYKLYGLPVVMLRPFMTYGPAQADGKLIPHVILSLLQRRSPNISSGEQQIDWIYIDDVIDGFVAAAEAQDIDGETIDLGSGALVSVRAVVNQLVDVMGSDVKPLFGALADRPCEPVRVADIGYARKKLGWTPQTPLQTGLAQTIEWYRQRA